MGEVEHGCGHARLVSGSAQGTELSVELAGQAGGDIALHRGGGASRLGIGHGEHGGDRVRGPGRGQVVAEGCCDVDDLSCGLGEGVPQVRAQHADGGVGGGAESTLDDDEGDFAPQLCPDGVGDPCADAGGLQGLDSGSGASGGAAAPLPQGQGADAADGADSTA